MKAEDLDQIVKVGAVFKGGSDIRPKWFVWEGRKYTIKEVNYVWHDREGRAKLHCFSVTDGLNTYELSFNSETTAWKLKKICGE